MARLMRKRRNIEKVFTVQIDLNTTNVQSLFTALSSKPLLVTRIISRIDPDSPNAPADGNATSIALSVNSVSMVNLSLDLINSNQYAVSGSVNFGRPITDSHGLDAVIDEAYGAPATVLLDIFCFEQ